MRETISLVICFIIAGLLLLIETVSLAIWSALPFKKTDTSKTVLEKESDIQRDFAEIVTSKGYPIEQHVVQTVDGYYLGVHRILPREPRKGKSKGVILLQHGFMMCSEAFIALGENRAIAYILVNAGYDVWLGNNRGNKYSYKHDKLSPNDNEFWNFSIDDLALKDIPATIDYILNHTKLPSLSYIGFSQGTAQAFASFSVLHDLSAKVKVFIALAPSTRTNGLNNPIVRSIIASRTFFVHLLFGKKILLSECLFWRSLLSCSSYSYAVSTSMKLLFGWTLQNIEQEDRVSLSAHLYSYGSVKCLIHWFQITRSKRFQMYDESYVNPMHHPGYHSHVIPEYCPSQIKCPVALFYGGADNLPDMDWLLKQVPAGTFVHCEDTYEHLDFLFAKTATTNIYPKVLDVLERHK